MKSNNDITWVIEKYIFEEYDQQLATAIKNSGAKVVFFDDTTGVNFEDFLASHFTNDDVVIFHGSLQLGRRMSHLPYYPGVFMNIDNYECYKYYGYYGNALLNADYIMMGLNDVVRKRGDIQKLLPDYGFGSNGQKKEIFIRPSNGYKTFTGQVLSYDSLADEISLLQKSYGGSIDPDTLVLISPTQNILKEYRFIVVDGKVVNGSIYMDEGNKGTFKPYYDKPCMDQEAINFAKLMASRYQPDKAYTMDICLVQEVDYHHYKLLEINSFNCASMYGAVLSNLVSDINRLAIREYNDLFEI